MTSIPTSSNVTQDAPGAARSREGHEAHIARLRVAMRRLIQSCASRQAITPECVYAYAALHLTTDSGIPIAPAAHHVLWVKLLCDPAITKLLLIAPPESAKTTWVISAFVGCYIGIWPERSVIIGSTSGPVAEKRSLSLRVSVESRAWQATFPRVSRAIGLPWKTNEWSLARDGMPHAGRLHPTVGAYGTGGSVVGSRADLVIADDLLDYANTGTQFQRQFVERWFHSVLLSRRKSQTGKVVVVGTAYHHDDLYEHLKADGSWVVCHIPLLSDTPEVYATVSYPDDYTGQRLGESIGDTRALGQALA